MSRVSRLSILALATVLVAVPTLLAAQQEERAVYASVLDKSDVPVTSLDAKDFVVREDGVPREVLRVEPASKPMHIAVLVDTSLSMARGDGDLSGEARGHRSEQVLKELLDNRLVEKLRSRHDVHVYRFDQEPKVERLAVFDKHPAAITSADAAAPVEAPVEASVDWRALVRKVPRPLFWTLAIAFGATLL